MRKQKLSILGKCFWAFWVMLIGIAQMCFAQSPTYASSVAGIIYQSCTNCHRVGGIGPFSLEGYDDAQVLAQRIKQAVVSKHMPPWPPDPDYKRYHGERFLTQGQIDTIVAWVDAGAPRGIVSQEPPVPVFTDASRMVYPVDTLLRIPMYTIPSDSDVYRCFVLPSGTTLQQWVRGVEMVAGNTGVVHHMLLYADTTGTCRAFDAADPLPGYTSYGGVGANSAVLVAGWAPGSDPVEYPSGFGSRLPARADYVLQIHYSPNSRGQRDSSYFRLSYGPTSSIRREVFQVPILNHFSTLTNGPLLLAPNQQKNFIARFTSPVKASLLAVFPHAHLICRNWKVYGLPLGSPDTVPLIRIPNWDFHWQGQYRFHTPVVVSPFMRLEAQAFYDNTGLNPHNPFNPPQPIVAGEGTQQEMMLVYFAFAAYQLGDDTLQLTPTSTKPHTRNRKVTWMVKNQHVVSEGGKVPESWQLRSLDGRLLAKGLGNDRVPTVEQPSGLYALWVIDKQSTYVLRVVGGN